jgi:hypothetical protein
VDPNYYNSLKVRLQISRTGGGEKMSLPNFVKKTVAKNPLDGIF